MRMSPLPYPAETLPALTPPALADLGRRYAIAHALLDAPLCSETLTGPVELVGVVTNRLSESFIGPALVEIFAVSVCDRNRTALLRAPAGVAGWLAERGVFTVTDPGDPVGIDAVAVFPFAQLDDATIDTATGLWEPYADRSGSYRTLDVALAAALALHAC
jgi:hypothetical protein